MPLMSSLYVLAVVDFNFPTDLMLKTATCRSPSRVFTVGDWLHKISLAITTVTMLFTYIRNKLLPTGRVRIIFLLIASSDKLHWCKITLKFVLFFPTKYFYLGLKV